MFEYFGGTTNVLICDNLKTGVIKHPATGDIVLQRDYEAFANYYGMAIIPARVRRPKDYLQTQIIFKNRRKQFKHCTSAIWF